MDPTNPASYFKADVGAGGTNGAFVVTWEPVTGRVYSVWRRGSLTETAALLESGIRPPRNSYSDDARSGDEAGFYTIEVELDDGDDGPLPPSTPPGPPSGP